MDELNKWETQFRKGILEALVLIALQENGKMYGYQLVEYLRNNDMPCSEGTVYPLLNRMAKNNWLDSVWDIPTQSGNPKRYYTVSKFAATFYQDMLNKMEQYQTVITNVRNVK